MYSNWPLGAFLPGRKISASESWTGLLRAAHCDELETEYRFAGFGKRMSIVGRSTPKAEQSHQIRVRVEATFLPDEGIVEEGRIDISFAPSLGMVSKSTVRFAFSRR